MNREEVLDYLVNHLKTWEDLGGWYIDEWRFEESIFCHIEFAAITIHEWNRAKIKPNTKIRIESPEHSEYVQKLSFEAGFKWSVRGEEVIRLSLEESYMHFDGRLISHSTLSVFEAVDNKEIHIEMPKYETESKTREELEEENVFERVVAANVEHYQEINPVEKLAKPTDINVKVLAEKVGSKHSHYFKDVSDLDEVDVYHVCDLFEVDDASGATQHAIKKLLCSGKRGVKDKRKDLEEARDTIIRKLQIMDEDK